MKWICVLQWVGWGEASESRALCILLGWESSQSGRPEVAGFFKMVAPAGTGCALVMAAGWHVTCPGWGFASQSLFRSCESLEEKARSCGVLGWP